MRALTENLDPNVIAWLRDWWVGRAYAQCLARSRQGRRDDRRAGKEPGPDVSNSRSGGATIGPLACSWPFSSMARASPSSPSRNGRRWRESPS